MADGVEIKVDGTRANLKLDKVPIVLRDALRRALPPLVRQLAGVVDANLSSGLKSRKTLTTKQEIRENAQGISGRVSVTSPSANGLLPHYLEEGTQPHLIEGNPILAFYWEKLGKQMFLHSVNHPGFAGIHYMQNAFDSMQTEIVETLQAAAHDATAGLR